MARLLEEDDATKIAEKAHGESDVRVLEFALRERDKHGYLGMHLRLDIHAEVAGRKKAASFFVKTYRVPEEGQLDFLGETGIFRKEVTLYKDVFRKFGLLARMPPWCPRYFFSKHRVLDFMLDKEHLKQALKAVAALHACTMIVERKEGTPLDAMHPACFKEILYEEGNTTSPTYMWKQRQVRDLTAGVEYLDMYSPQEKEMIKKYLPAAIDRIYFLSKKSDRWPNVMVHGDMWSNNLLFRYEGSNPVECRLVDFQFSRYAPPMHDIMGLLHLTTNKAFRDENEEELLLEYYRLLTQHLLSNGLDVKEYYTWDTFLESRNSYRLLSIIQSLLSIHYLLGGRRTQEDPMFGTWSKDEVEEHLSKNREETVKTYFDDKVYSTRIGTILKELADVYILNEEQRTSMGISL